MPSKSDVVSGSPVLEGFGDLQALLAESPDEVETQIAGQLAAWPEAAAGGTLDLAAVQFYVDFWGGLGDRWRGRSPERAAEFGKRLSYFLQRTLGLFPFSPAAYQEFPDGWVQRVVGRMLTGRVRRVIRPGLLDRENQLRVPALVEVE